MITVGKLRKQINERATPAAAVETITVPGSGGSWGDYSIRLEEVPVRASGVEISGYTESDSLPPAEDEFYVNYRNGIITFDSTAEAEVVSISYVGRGSMVDAYDMNVVQTVANIPFYINGIPSTTPASGYLFKIPLGAFGANSQFGAADVTPIAVQGITIQAEIFEGDIITGESEFCVSNGVKDAVDAYGIVITLTNSAEETDRNVSASGLFYIAPATQALYIHCNESGGHGNIQGWVWLRRELP